MDIGPVGYGNNVKTYPELWRKKFFDKRECRFLGLGIFSPGLFPFREFFLNTFDLFF
jgi:hypothetical protein